MEHIGEVYNEMEVSFDSHSSMKHFARESQWRHL